MNVIELEKIIFTLHKYDLLSEIKNIRKWLLSLDEKQIANFINLDIKLNNYLLKNKKLIIDNNFLSFDSYLYDLKLLSKTNNLDTIFALLNVIFDETAKKGVYYNESKELLSKTYDPIKIWCLKNLIINEGFIKLEYSYKVLEMIYNSSVYNSYIIYLIVINNTELNYDDLVDEINKKVYKKTDNDVIIYNKKSNSEKSLKIKNQDELYEMMYKIKAYTDDDKKDVARLILK